MFKLVNQFWPQVFLVKNTHRIGGKWNFWPRVNEVRGLRNRYVVVVLVGVKPKWNFMHYAVHSKYILCLHLHNCIHLHLCTCIHLHTCVHLHILLRSCNFFSHLHRTFCSLHRILPLFRTCKIFLTQIFKCPNKKKRVFTFCYFSTFVQNLFF